MSLLDLKNILCDHKAAIHTDHADRSVFFALKGASFDGHCFVDCAEQQGAVAAVVHKGYTKSHKKLRLIHVEDPRETLYGLAQQKRASIRDVIGITGTCGKTSTKEILFAFLRKSYSVGKTLGNYNTPEGIALSLINEPVCSVFLMEMGVRQNGDMEQLIKLYSPDIGLLTALGPAHLTFFKDQESYEDEKYQLLHAVKKAYSAVTVSIRHCTNIQGLHRDKRVEAYCARYPLVMRNNIMSAVAVAKELGVDVEAMVSTSLPQLPYRFSMKMHEGITIIDDSYNANPLSMLKAFESLPKQKNTIAVLGSMKELGENTARLHEEVYNEAKKIFATIFLVGPEWNRPAFSQEEILELLKQTLSKRRSAFC